MPKTIQVNDELYEIASDATRISSEYIYRVWDKVGRPPLIESEFSWKVVDAIMQVWYANFPYEVEDWKQTLKDSQALERTPHEAQKQEGGYFPISYPQRLYELLKTMFPEQNLADMEFIRKMVSRYPILKITKYKI